jgi:hypothetical protein
MPEPDIHALDGGCIVKTDPGGMLRYHRRRDATSLSTFPHRLVS